MKFTTRNPIFWVFFTTLSCMCAVGAWKLFPKAFPLISIDLKMSKSQALEKADELNSTFGWIKPGYRSAVSFETDDSTKTYIELEAGGVKVFEKMIQDNLYQPYYWQVRQFHPFETNENLVFLTPAGKPYGFIQTISENQAGPHIDAQKAQKIAELQMTTSWQINLKDYSLLERHTDVAPSGRADHTFVYQRKEGNIGASFFRVKAIVSGDTLSAVVPLVKIPESFKHKYQELRSSNNHIAFGASIAMLLLYILGGCVIGLYFMLKKRWVIWRPAVFWGCLISFLQLLTQVNQLPNLWMQYNTALAPNLFLVDALLGFLRIFVVYSALFSLIIACAETLTRKAFAHHLQFWKLWSIDGANSQPILGRTLGGYLMVPLMLLFGMSLYIVALNYFGWWMPSDTLVDPNILATYAPWLSALALSLQAGFIEECLFRAIPLAGAYLLGERYGNKKLLLIGAFIMQIIIFGAAHANYATQPAYARLIELIIPSTIFGLLYLFYGLLVSIICHVVFDIFWFAQPLFVSQAAGAWMNQLAVIVLSLIPILVIVGRYIQTKKWHSKLSDTFYNGAWRAGPPQLITRHVIKEQKTVSLPKIPFIICALVCLAALAVRLAHVQQDAQPLHISRAEATTSAIEALHARGVEIQPPWQAMGFVRAHFSENKSVELQHEYIWHLSKDLYHKLMADNFLNSAYWVIRFARFQGSLSERAEEYQIVVDDRGVRRIVHILPEDRPGNTLDKRAAQEIAFKALHTMFNLDRQQVKEISAQEKKHPQRTDWAFEFAVEHKDLPKDQARIAMTIAGDEVVDAFQYIKVPEEYQRDQAQKQTLLSILKYLCVGLLMLLMIVSIVLIGLHYYGTHLSLSGWLIYFISMGIIFLLLAANRWPRMSAGFNTIEPWAHQLFSHLSSITISTLMFAAGLSIIVYTLSHARIASAVARNRISILHGFSLGLLVATIIEYSQWLYPQKPFWISYSPLSDFLPIAVITDPLVGWTLATSLLGILLLGYHFLVRKYHMPAIVRLLLMIAFVSVISGALALDTFTGWICVSILLGLAAWIIYEGALQYDFAFMSLVVAAPYMMRLVKEALLNPYPWALLLSCIGMAALLLASILWFFRLNIQE